MLKEELIEALNKLPDGSDIYMRYGSINYVDDIEFRFCVDETENGIGEFYLAICKGSNIQDAHLDTEEDVDLYTQKIKRIEQIGEAYLEEENTPSFVDKVIQIEIDSDLFFNEVSMDVTSWSFDLYDLEQNKPVYEYIKENHAEELKALEDGKAKYIEVYRDTF